MKIYNDAVDKNVAVNVVYIGQAIDESADQKAYVAYYDKELTQPVKLEELKNLYLKGLVVCGLADLFEGEYEYSTPLLYSVQEYNGVPQAGLMIFDGLIPRLVISDPEEAIE